MCYEAFMAVLRFISNKKLVGGTTTSTSTTTTKHQSLHPGNQGTVAVLRVARQRAAAGPGRNVLMV